jgi:hypothetical protein
MELPELVRACSIGDSTFAERLAASQEAAAAGDIAHPADIEDEEQAGGPAGGLMPAPQATQAMDDFGGDDGDDDRELELLREKYGDLNSKTFRIKELLTRKAGLAGEDPFDLMQSMHDTIAAMPAGADKDNCVAMYNAVFAVYESARGNEKLREFAAGVFTAQLAYYNNKAKKAALNAELKMLNQLYDEQEEAQMMENLAKKRAARAAALQQKATEKAAKRAEKGEPSAKKQRPA